jgi:hypothetical protein
MDKKFWTTLLEGAIDGLTFGIYHAYVSQRMIEEHNAKLKRAMEDKLNKGNELKNGEKG